MRLYSSKRPKDPISSNELRGGGGVGIIICHWLDRWHIWALFDLNFLGHY